MKTAPIEILRERRGLLDPVMRRQGFSFTDGPAGASSGGRSASESYSDGDRKLEIHLRFFLRLVGNHLGRASLDQESYMHAQLGTKGGNSYPRFSQDPLGAFKGLAYHLGNFAIAFLNGSFEVFARCVIAAEERKKIPGFARLP